MGKPNILLITTDQQSATMMSCTGNPDLQTPNMDALAADGVRFEKAYVAQPLCIPQRCSWYTGLMPHEHGITFNIADRQVTADCSMGQVFRPAGIMGRAVRTDRYKYMVYSEGDNREFLADMNKDPGEMRNLAGDPAYIEELEGHRVLLRQYIRNTGDIFPVEMVGQL